jgi:hypothetical protein
MTTIDTIDTITILTLSIFLNDQVLHNLICGCSSDIVHSHPQNAAAESTLFLTIQHGVVNALAELAHIPNPETMRGCAAALSVLACYIPGQEKFVISGGLSALVTLSGSDKTLLGTKRYVTADCCEC